MAMRRPAAIVALVFLLLFTSAPFAQEKPAPEKVIEPVPLPVLSIRLCDSPPRIDGRLRERCWREAAAADLQFRVGGGKPEQPAFALLCCDDKALYIAARLTEPNEPASRYIRRDGDFSGQDTFEVFVDIGAGALYYYRLVVNPANARLDERCMTATGLHDPSWNGAWESATVVEKGMWTAELAIPWSDLKLYFRKGYVIGLNLCRRRAATGELCTWSPTEKSFAEPQRFGAAVLGAKIYPRHPGIRTDKILWDPQRGLTFKMVVWDTSAIQDRVRLFHHLRLPSGRTESTLRLATLDLDTELRYEWGPIPVEEAGQARLVVTAEKGFGTRSVFALGFDLPPKG